MYNKIKQRWLCAVFSQEKNMRQFMIFGLAAFAMGAQGSLFFDDFDAGTSSANWDRFNSNTDFVVDFARDWPAPSE